MKKYDYVIVGAGLFGATFAHEATKQGKRCLVIEKRNHIGGNIYTEEIQGIQVHRYGAHIFHTSNEEVWKYVNQFTKFNHFINAPIANYKGKLYNLPFNMNTFYQIWGVKTPAEAKAKIEVQRQAFCIQTPRNLEEQAISLVGNDIYRILIKGYTEKQWGRECKDLPASIISRLPCRISFDNNYFSDRYQGIPKDGYTNMIKKMMGNIDIQLNTNFLDFREELESLAEKIIYTGTIDSYFGYTLGHLEYRSLRFDTEVLPIDNYQGVAVVNYTERKIPYTRIIEHKHFDFGMQPTTVITREYPLEWSRDIEPYYPVNDTKNITLYNKYLQLAQTKKNIYFAGRLGTYQYLDMDEVINKALKFSQSELYK